ncbi:hypothetical protein AAG906_019449 [Vitis piasezkii]
MLAALIIKILCSLTPVQLTTLVILLKLSLVFSHIQSDQFTIGDGNSLPIPHTFHSSYFFVKDQVTKKILLKGWLRDGLYEFSSSSPPRAFVTTSSFSDGAIWHSRLGHPAAPFFLRL